MDKDGRLLLRIRAADMARIDGLAGTRGRSAWVRRVIAEALAREERQVSFTAAVEAKAEADREMREVAQRRRQEAMDRMRRNAK